MWWTDLLHPLELGITESRTKSQFNIPDFLCRSFMSTFRFKAFSIPAIKLFTHRFPKYPPKLSVFHLEFGYYLSWAFHLSSHFLKPLKAIKAHFLLLSALQRVFTSAKYHLYIQKKIKPNTFRIVTQWNTLVGEVVEYYPGQIALVDPTLSRELRWDDLQRPLPPSSTLCLSELWLP